jgi:hypothetical protein
MKLSDNRSVDLMRDFKDQSAGAAGDIANKRANKDEDSVFISLTKLKERLLQRSMKDNTLLYRKVMRIDKGRKNIMISALREENQMYDSTLTNAPVSEKKKKKGGRSSSLSKDSDEKALRNEKYLVKLVLFENKRFDKTI